MRRALVVILSFAVVTIGLTWFWEEVGRLQYGRFLKTVAPSIYDWIGFGDARVGAMRQRYINWIPFVGLVVSTPGLAWKRRLIGLVLGMLGLFVGHLVLNLTESPHQRGHLPFVPSLVSDTLPLILWVILAFPALTSWFDSSRGLFEAAARGDTDETERPTEDTAG